MTPVRLARNASAGLVASIAAIASYRHMQELAAHHGQEHLLASLMPISVDGMLIVATVAMHDDRLAGRKVRTSAWIAFIVGVFVSVAANTLAAPAHTLDRIISAWPAISLLLVVEVLARTGRTAEPSQVKAPEAQVITGDKVLSDPQLITGYKLPESRRGTDGKVRPAKRPVVVAAKDERRSTARRSTKQPRRPVELTRRLAAELSAAEPGLSQEELAERLGITARRLRAVLAQPVEPAMAGQ